MNLPLVTVIISAYNHEKYVEDAVLSVINQTYENIELLVFDDGSSDATPEIIEILSLKYNFYFERQKNIGLPATRNKGIRMAKGEFIAGVASDDIMEVFRIERLVEVILPLSDEVAVVCGDASFIDEFSKPTFWDVNGKKFFTFMGFYSYLRQDIQGDCFGSYRSLIKSNYIPAAAVLIRKKALLEVGLYDENNLLEDWDIWLKFARVGYEFRYVNEVVSCYRWHASNTVKVLKYRVLVDSTRLLLREVLYCLKNNNWACLIVGFEELFKKIVWVIRYKYFGFREK